MADQVREPRGQGIGRINHVEISRVGQECCWRKCQQPAVTEESSSKGPGEYTSALVASRRWPTTATSIKPCTAQRSVPVRNSSFPPAPRPFAAFHLCSLECYLVEVLPNSHRIETNVFQSCVRRGGRWEGRSGSILPVHSV